jgi:hypothetical protein
MIFLFLSIVDSLRRQQLIKFNSNVKPSHAPFRFWRPLPSNASIVFKAFFLIIILSIHLSSLIYHSRLVPVVVVPSAVKSY